jgi:hypothetical protein
VLRGGDPGSVVAGASARLGAKARNTQDKGCENVRRAEAAQPSGLPDQPAGAAALANEAAAAP